MKRAKLLLYIDLPVKHLMNLTLISNSEKLLINVANCDCHFGILLSDFNAKLKSLFWYSSIAAPVLSSSGYILQIEFVN